jgi:ABC-type uncharacterized transport system substrate-binding protein
MIAACFRRRVAAAVAVGATLIGPVHAEQARAIPRIGVLISAAATAPGEEGLRTGLRELGYVEGKSIFIEWRRFSGREEEIRSYAIDLAGSGVALIVAAGSPAARAALETTKLPVVFASGDPVAAGFATSLARPGGNGTGVSVLSSELYPKRLDLLHQLAPRARRIAILRNPANPLAAHGSETLNTAALALGVKLERLDARDAREVQQALRALQRHPPAGLLVSADTLFLSHKAEIAEAVRKAQVPAIFPWKEYHEDQVLMTYGLSVREMMRRMASYVDKVLRGGHPADMPIEQFSQYELVINLRVAHEMHLKIPEALLVRADEVLR